VRFEVGESDTMKFFYGGAMAVSPDGHWMVFPATGEDGVNRYWIRSDLDGESLTRPTSPLLSPFTSSRSRRPEVSAPAVRSG
jgi:hypothetical protein